MAYPTPPNYDLDALSTWMRSQIARYKADGRQIQDFREDLSFYMPNSEKITRTVMRKLRQSSDSPNDEKLKTLSLNRLNGIIEFRKKEEDVEMTLAEAKEWLSWVPEVEAAEKSQVLGLARKERHSVEVQAARIDRLEGEVDELRHLVSSLLGAPDKHPFVELVHGILNDLGIDPETDEGRSLIKEKAEGTPQGTDAVAVIFGEQPPSIPALGPVMALMTALAGHGDWITPDFAKMAGVVQFEKDPVIDRKCQSDHTGPDQPLSHSPHQS